MRRAKKQYKFDGFAGCVRRWVNRAGKLVGVYHSEQAGIDTYGWSVVCEKHHTVNITTSLRVALHVAADTHLWCGPCQEDSL